MQIGYLIDILERLDFGVLMAMAVFPCKDIYINEDKIE